MSKWKEKLAKQPKEEIKEKSTKKNETLDTFTHPSPLKSKEEPSLLISPEEIEQEVRGYPLWEFTPATPHLTSDTLRNCSNLIYHRGATRLRKNEILEDLLKISLGNLPPDIALKYVQSFLGYYNTIKGQLNKNIQSLSS